MKEQPKHVLILCGGQSPEHAISIRSAKNVVNAINPIKYLITIFGITKSGKWFLIDLDEQDNEIVASQNCISIHPGSTEPFQTNSLPIPKFDVVFPILHGPNGEDGTVQGLLKLLGIPFVGSGVMSSSATMDKDITKQLLIQSGLKVADGITILRGSEIPSFGDISSKFGKTVFVKPANMGSSVGVHKVSTANEWIKAIDDAFRFDRKVLIEKELKGRELECAVLGNEVPKASGVGEVKIKTFYSYEEKYTSTSEAEIIIPAEVSKESLALLKQTALAAYRALNCSGLARVDMFLSENEEVLVNEVNSIPGFTSISMYPKLWMEEGVSYAELIDQLLDLAIENHQSS